MLFITRAFPPLTRAALVAAPFFAEQVSPAAFMAGKVYGLAGITAQASCDRVIVSPKTG